MIYQEGGRRKRGKASNVGKIEFNKQGQEEDSQIEQEDSNMIIKDFDEKEEFIISEMKSSTNYQDLRNPNM